VYASHKKYNSDQPSKFKSGILKEREIERPRNRWEDDVNMDLQD
jgi:hypothetical protein